jgi:phosphatidate cytidylyltransferase
LAPIPRMPTPADNSPPQPPKPASKGRVFARRLGSTVALWVVLISVFTQASPWMFCALVAVIVMLGLVEYFRLFPDAGHRRFQWIAYGVGLAYVGALFAPALGFPAPWLRELDGAAVAVLMILIIFARLHRPLEGIQTLNEIAVTVFGFIYIVLLFGFVPKILMLPLTDAAGASQSHFYILYLVAVTKFTDMGAYAIGSLIGRHKMVPHVSPGKTWQGFGGAIFGAYVASFGFLALFGDTIPRITPVHAGVLALALSLVAVLGDLAESILKRSVAAKDSGHGLPGIGGVLDLIDSVLFTAPVLFFYLLVLLS